MKTLIATLFILAGLGGISMADEILIYKAAETDKSSGDKATTSHVNHYYGFFDVTTSEVTFIYYAGTTAANKTYSTYSNTPIISGPLTPSVTGSSTVFAYSTSTASTPFYFDTGIFQGTNSQLTLGGGFSGEFPKVLSYSELSFRGSGTGASDSVFKGSGSYILDLALTVESNSATAGGNSLANAVTMVVNLLKSEGY